MAPDKDGDAAGPKPIKFEVPPQLASGVYANCMMVTHSPWDYVLTFFHLLPPALGDQPGQAQAVARIVIPAKLIDEIIGALGRNRDDALASEKKEEA